MNATKAMSNSNSYENNKKQEESCKNDKSSEASPLTINTQMATHNHQQAVQIPQLPPQFINNFNQSSTGTLPPMNSLPPPHLDSSNSNNGQSEKPNISKHNPMQTPQQQQNGQPASTNTGETKTLVSGTIPSPIAPLGSINPLPPVHVPERGQPISSPNAPLSGSSTGSNQAPQSSNTDENNPPPPPTTGRKKIKTRFPLARIKRIMQDNEEVGKIATVAPHLISKSLELFLADLISKSSQITKDRNAKTMSSQHLKECIMNEENFDFLRDLVEDIPDRNNQSEPKKKRKKA